MDASEIWIHQANRSGVACGTSVTVVSFFMGPVLSLIRVLLATELLASHGSDVTWLATFTHRSTSRWR
jgi:hypothetical protein